jgi:NAD-dependent deacetylase
MPIHDPQLLEVLNSASRIAVLTGAGVSAESGIPTFRDAMSGLWAKYDPADLATPQAFERNPEVVSRWYDERRCNIAGCKPNAGHIALAELEGRRISAKSFTLITQNVDRLHQAAGSKNVIELPGTLWIWRCLDCGKESEERGSAFRSYPLYCPCGGMRRPGVVWFGEALPYDAMAIAENAVASCDLFMSIGTSSVVYPAAGLIDWAIKAKKKSLEINPAATDFSALFTWSIRGRSGDVLPELVAAGTG